jgi:hypothetical protein
MLAPITMLCAFAAAGDISDSPIAVASALINIPSPLSNISIYFPRQDMCRNQRRMAFTEPQRARVNKTPNGHGISYRGGSRDA